MGRDDDIRTRAYQIWEREGRPHGRDIEHWRQAPSELNKEINKKTAATVLNADVQGNLRAAPTLKAKSKRK